MSVSPIACLLTGQDFQARLKWIADLNHRSLKQRVQDDLRLTLTYEPLALAEVEEMAKQERACCPFLSFSIQSYADRVTLNITAPEDARDIVETVFEPFISAEQARGCSCCGAAA